MFLCHQNDLDFFGEQFMQLFNSICYLKPPETEIIFCIECGEQYFNSKWIYKSVFKQNYCYDAYLI